MTDRKASAALLAGILGTGFLTTVYFFTSAMDPFNLPKSVLIVGGGLAALMGGVALLGNFEKARLGGVIPLALFGLVFIIAAIIGTDDSRRLFYGAFSRATGLLTYLGLILLAIGAVLSTRGARFQYVYLALGSVAVVETLYGFLQYVNADPFSWVNPYNRIIGTLGNPNFMSATLGFTGAAMVGVALNRKLHMSWRITGAFLAVSEFLLALASESVQGPISFGGGVAVILGVYIWGRKPKSPLFFTYSAAVSAVLVVVLLGVARIGPLAEKLYQYTLNVRTQYWRAALRMMADSPLTGVGVDSFGENYRLVRNAETFKVVGPEVFTNAAHSVPLQLGATAGIPVLVLYVALQIFVIYRVCVMFKREADHRMAIAGIAGAWVAFQAQSLISIDQIGVGVWGWILSGCLIGGSYAVVSEEPVTKKKARAQQKSKVSVVSLLVTFGFIVGVAVDWKVGYSPDLAVRTAIAIPFDGNNAQSVAYRTNALVAAIDTAPKDITYQSIIIQEVAKMPGTAVETEKIARDLATKFPDSWDAQNLAATILEAVGKPADAIRYRERQLPLDPANWVPKNSLAIDLEKTLQIARAKVVYQQVVDAAPKSPEGVAAADALKRLNGIESK